MREQQRRALSLPCYLAGETVHPRFGTRVGHLSVIVTVNAGYE
jgi:hypothetical protein